jgi:hypothetical protein
MPRLYMLLLLCTLSPANEEDTECDKNTSGDTADSSGAVDNSRSSTAEQAISEQLDAAKDRRQHLQQQQQQQHAHSTASPDTSTDTQQQKEQQKDVDQPLEDVDDDEECYVADDVSCSGETPTDSTADPTAATGGSANGSAMAAAQSEVQGEHTPAEHSGGPYYHILVVTVLSLQLPSTAADSSVSTASTSAADQVHRYMHLCSITMMQLHARLFSLIIAISSSLGAA